MTTFADIAADIIQKKQTGLLSMVERKGEHHLKIFFEEGEIYYMTYGDLKNAQCMVAFETLELSEYFFTKGAKVATNGRCQVRTEVIIEQVKKCMDKSQVPASPPKDSPAVQNLSMLETKLKEALIRQIGPVGDIVFLNILEQWRSSSPPPGQRPVELVELLQGTIEDEKSRQEFLKEAGAIIH